MQRVVNDGTVLQHSTLTIIMSIRVIDCADTNVLLTRYQLQCIYIYGGLHIS